MFYLRGICYEQSDNWKKAVSRRRDRKEVFNKSGSSRHYSDKEIEQRKKDKKWWIDL